MKHLPIIVLIIIIAALLFFFFFEYFKKPPMEEPLLEESLPEEPSPEETFTGGIDPNKVVAGFLDSCLQEKYKPETIEIKEMATERTYEFKWTSLGKVFYIGIYLTGEEKKEIGNIFLTTQFKEKVETELEAKDLLKDLLIFGPEVIDEISCEKKEIVIRNCAVSFECEKFLEKGRKRLWLYSGVLLDSQENIPIVNLTYFEEEAKY